MEQIYLDDMERIINKNGALIYLISKIDWEMLLEILERAGKKEVEEYNYKIDKGNKINYATTIRTKHKTNKETIDQLLGTITLWKDEHPMRESKLLWSYCSNFGNDAINIDKDDGIYNSINGVIEKVNEDYETEMNTIY